MPHRIYQAAYSAVLPKESKGYGLILCGGSTPSATDFEKPSRRGELLIRFDTDDPPTENIFNAQRNVYGRPQREIALFFAGAELVRRLCPTELAGAAGHAVTLKLEFVTGGALLTLKVGTAAVFDAYLIPDLMPCAEHLSYGGGATFSSQTFSGSGAAPKNPAPIRIRAIDNELIDSGHHGGTSWFDLPTDIDRIGRVICTFTLDRTPHGLDAWDRIGNLYVLDDKGERFELLRFITPYRRAYRWTQDVTDLLPLLTGHRRLLIDCGTYGPGWLASVDLTYYPGPAARHPYKVVNLWNTTALIGQASHPFLSFVPPSTIPIDTKADAVAVRLIVTGHGEDPNTDNAAEFLSLWRKLHVGGGSYQNTLWKDDNYLNPCRPQGGTWKFDRAGWGPGTVVDPWLVDVSANVHAGTDATFEYELQPYVNKTPNNGDPARYVIGSQVIFYRSGAPG